MTHLCSDSHVHVEENGEDMTCNDCGRPAFYDYDDEWYHHTVDPERGCFLIGPEVDGVQGEPSPWRTIQAIVDARHFRSRVQS